LVVFGCCEVVDGELCVGVFEFGYYFVSDLDDVVVVVDVMDVG